MAHHQNNKEITALLHLMDDPDTEVFETVAGRLLDYGKAIIPRLEQLWENTLDETVQLRIESLIHRALFQELQKNFAVWAKKKNASLLDGALLIANYRYPELDKDIVLSEIEAAQKNIWLELNHYLSPLEQVNVINSILYSYYKIQGEDNVNKDPDLYCLNHLLESKHGNSFSIGILYLVICETLDIPIFGVNLPRQFILGFFDNLYHFLSPRDNPVQSIQFYIDPVNGMVYTQNDVNVYLSKINERPPSGQIKPLTAKEIIFKMLDELSATYFLHHEQEKAEEIRQLQDILKPYIPD
ncbi:MAG TPA: transglutaminase family protein [Edaphocola sp.]|nr:transglutaminase family protein [Edaphocola sp.]